MTAVELLNLALLKIGQSKAITATSDATRAAWTGAQVYDHMLRATLRAFPWSFATKYADLYLVQGPDWEDALVQAWSSTATYVVGDAVLEGGVVYYCILAHTNQPPPNATYWETTATTEANGDWLYAYRWPSDCLFARRIVPASDGGGGGRRFNDTPIPFRIGRDANGLLVYTHEQDANLEYTTIDCTNLWTDDLWLDAFTWRLAAALAPSLSRDPKIALQCQQMFMLTLEHAAAVSSREQQIDKPGEAEWVRGR